MKAVRRGTQIFDYAAGSVFWTDDDRVAEYLANRGYRAALPDDPGYEGADAAPGEPDLVAAPDVPVAEPAPEPAV